MLILRCLFLPSYAIIYDLFYFPLYRFHRNFIENLSYVVDFKFSRSTLQVMHRAVENAVPYLQTIPFNGWRPNDDPDNDMMVARLTRLVINNRLMGTCIALCLDYQMHDQNKIMYTGYTMDS